LLTLAFLHRNELSGALSGLTRVRRFQQDDAHIYCTEEQIESEVLGALNFMKDVYTTFGMTYKLELSTRPAKALGEIALWDKAEKALAECDGRVRRQRKLACKSGRWRFLWS
jgi:threonyl-tRNA synthetase